MGLFDEISKQIKIENDSFEVVKDDDIDSPLTTNKAVFSINRISVKFIDDITMKYIYDVSINGYIINNCWKV